MLEKSKEIAIPESFFGIFSKEKVDEFAKSLLSQAKIITWEENMESFQVIENITDAKEYLQLIAKFTYFSQVNILETANEYRSSLYLDRKLQKLLTLKIKDLDPTRKIFTSFDSVEISTSKLCEPATEKLHLSFLAQNINSCIVFKEQFPKFNNTFHYQICIYHPTLGYFLVDPTWQQMLDPKLRKPVNPNTLVLHIKYIKQNIQIDNIWQIMVEYGMKKSIIEQYL